MADSSVVNLGVRPWLTRSGRSARAARLCCACSLSLTAATLAGCAEALVRGPAIWYLSERHTVDANAQPSLENELYSAAERRVRLSAARGETVAVQVVLKTDVAGSERFDVRLSNLTSSAGDMLPSDTVARRFRVAPLRVSRYPSWYPAHTGRATTPRDVLDIAVPWEAPRGGGPVQLAAKTASLVWIDLTVPVATPPGLYRGRVEIAPAGGLGAPLSRVAFELEVLPLGLPHQPTLPIICRLDPQDLLTEHFGWPRDAGLVRLLPDAPADAAPIRLVQAMMELFAQHRTSPLLWACFPEYRPNIAAPPDIDWESYDAVVGDYISGAALGGVRPAVWALPVSIDHPSAAANGGFESPRYAALLAAYARQAEDHFAQRGWADRGVVRLMPPAPVSPELAQRQERLAGILRQAGVQTPLVAHMSPGSLRPLGLVDAPEIQPAEYVWSPPARWFDPRRLRDERGLGRQVWYQPEYPPYSGSIAPGLDGIDVQQIPWQALRYACNAVWIEHAAAVSRYERGADADAPLIHSGAPFGVLDRPLASLRLKRLRRGALDADLLALMAEGGRAALADRTARRMAPRGFSDAGVENLLSVRSASWSREPHVWWQAREALLSELAGAWRAALRADTSALDPDPDGNVVDPAPGAASQPGVAATKPEPPAGSAALLEWERMMTRDAAVSVTIEGARLSLQREAATLLVLSTVLNDTPQLAEGVWEIAAAPTGWELSTDARPVAAPALQRVFATAPLRIPSISWNPDGHAEFALQLRLDEARRPAAAARLAVLAAPRLDAALTLDGRIDEWPRSTSNSAGSFTLVRGDDISRAPALQSRAFVAQDAQNLYVAVACALQPGEGPLWQADSEVPVDGVIPWGQDVVEILLEPANLSQGTSGDLYCVQVKPSGVVVATRGARTEPPIGRVEPWASGARAAVQIEADAWTVELAIPVRSLGSAAARSRVWGFNVTRLDARRGEYSSWSGARGHCYAPQRLGNLLIVKP